MQVAFANVAGKQQTQLSELSATTLENCVQILLKHLTFLSALILVLKHWWCEKQGLYVHDGT